MNPKLDEIIKQLKKKDHEPDLSSGTNELVKRWANTHFVQLREGLLELYEDTQHLPRYREFDRKFDAVILIKAFDAANNEELERAGLTPWEMEHYVSDHIGKIATKKGVPLKLRKGKLEYLQLEHDPSGGGVDDKPVV